MPVITFNLVKELILKGGRPVTTNEIINHIADKSPRTLENLVPNMMVLEKAGFVKKRFDKEKDSYVWELGKPDLNGREMLEKHPELFEQSLYGEDSIDEIFRKKR